MKLEDLFNKNPHFYLFSFFCYFPLIFFLYFLYENSAHKKKNMSTKQINNNNNKNRDRKIQVIFSIYEKKKKISSTYNFDALNSLTI